MNAGPPSPSAPLRGGRPALLSDRRNLVLPGLIGLVLIGLPLAYLLATGHARIAVLVLLSLVGITCLSPRRGTYMLLLFLPFMYFLRRQVLHLDEFAPRDPILLFPPVVTITIFLGLVGYYRAELIHYMRRSALLKAVVALALLFSAQIFNPLQGNILIGLAGALYFIIPMLWVFVGLFLGEEDVKRVITLVMILGTITALYGIYQHHFGLSGVELEELQSKGSMKLLGTEQRVVSTFAGIDDFTTYLSTAGFLAFAHFWRRKNRPVALMALIPIAVALFYAAKRTSIFVLIFASLLYVIIHPREPRRILLRGAIALAVIGALYGFLYTMTPQQLFEKHRSSDPSVVHTISGIAHPTQEESFRMRTFKWSYIVTRGLVDQPFGRGLGSTTTATHRFEGGMPFEADSYFFEIIYGSSILAAILFLSIVTLFFRGSVKLAFEDEEKPLHKVLVVMVAAYMLGSVFGADVRDPINGPIAWLAIGWMIREIVEHGKEWAPVRASTPAPWVFRH